MIYFSFLFMDFFSRCFGSGCCKYLCMQGSKSLVCPGHFTKQNKAWLTKVIWCCFLGHICSFALEFLLLLWMWDPYVYVMYAHMWYFKIFVFILNKINNFIYIYLYNILRWSSFPSVLSSISSSIHPSSSSRKKKMMEEEEEGGGRMEFIQIFMWLNPVVYEKLL